MIDTTRVSELKREFGDDGFEEVLAIFVEETGPVVDRLSRGDSTDPAADLHFVRGSAENMGMNRLTEICRHGEAEVAQGKVPDLSEIRRSFDGSCAALARPAA